MRTLRLVALTALSATLLLGCSAGSDKPAAADSATPSAPPSQAAPSPSASEDPAGGLSLGEAMALLGKEWKVVALLDGEKRTPVPAGAEGAAHFTVDTDRKISGNLGCNRFSAEVTGSNPADFRLGPLAATRMACTGPAEPVEKAMTALFAGPMAAKLGQEDGRTTLTMRAKDGGAGLVATTG
ncbi:META domain-containing protein [Streptomyces sp. BI20]|uniref:META domain-containing protein n=1 Tax=Streptomyces sp. BI20 TaxID=3403460 RepID=UPI003C7635B7